MGRMDRQWTVDSERWMVDRWTDGRWKTVDKIPWTYLTGCSFLFFFSFLYCVLLVLPYGSGVECLLFHTILFTIMISVVSFIQARVISTLVDTPYLAVITSTIVYTYLPRWIQVAKRQYHVTLLF